MHSNTGTRSVTVMYWLAVCLARCLSSHSIRLSSLSSVFCAAVMAPLHSLVPWSSGVVCSIIVRRHLLGVVNLQYCSPPPPMLSVICTTQVANLLAAHANTCDQVSQCGTTHITPRALRNDTDYGVCQSTQKALIRLPSKFHWPSGGWPSYHRGHH